MYNTNKVYGQGMKANTSTTVSNCFSRAKLALIFLPPTLKKENSLTAKLLYKLSILVGQSVTNYGNTFTFIIHVFS